MGISHKEVRYIQRQELRFLKSLKRIPKACTQEQTDSKKKSFIDFIQTNHDINKTYRDDAVINFLNKRFKLEYKHTVSKDQKKELLVPEVFSISANCKDSIKFLHDLFQYLFEAKHRRYIISFTNCQKLDLDACVMMDIILKSFIKCFDAMNRRLTPIHPKQIKFKNIEKLAPKYQKMLFSVGAFNSIKGFNIRFDDVIPLTLKQGDSIADNSSQLKELHETEIVDYIVACAGRIGKPLKMETEKRITTVIGEIIANAEEHSRFRYRYAIGYFQIHETEPSVLNLSIFNFGRTIYEGFQILDSSNEIKQRMIKLSKKFTEENIFKTKSFEEETLWTLYALQDGVTSTGENRGNGTIRFVESFFGLCDPNDKKNSCMVIHSGNTQIIFDGTYQLVTKTSEQDECYQLITFNNSGRIEDKPDPKYVKFADSYFPGTLISIKIVLKDILFE